MRKSFKINKLVSVAFAALALSSTAHAQDAEADATGEADGDAIVVTGSRVVTNGNNSPTTIAVVTADVLTQTTPTNLADGLRKLPQLAASSGQYSSQPGANQFAASSFMNLRSLGPVRNLVLFDGNRLAPSSTVGAVDVNTIPQMLVQRIDVVTGGVSAVYGSDAVSGVINFVVDKKFNGVKAIGQAGISEQGDNFTYRMGVAAGTSFGDDRGHIEGSFEYFNSDGVESNKARPNGAARYMMSFDAAKGAPGTATNPYTLVSNVTIGNTYSFGGHIIQTRNAAGTPITTAFSDSNFTSDGVLSPYVHGASTGIPGFEIGGDGAYYQNSLAASLRTKQGFLRVDYSLTDSVNVHAQGMLTQTDSVGTYIEPIVGGAGTLAAIISADNAFLSPTVKSQLAAAGVSTFVIRKFQINQEHVKSGLSSRNIYANLGFDGKIGSNFKWTLDYGHNEARRIETVYNNGRTANLFAALDAVVAPSTYTGSDFLLNAQGQKVVCNVTITNPGLYPGCLPLNVFGPTAENPAAQRFTQRNTNVTITQKQDTFAATISGKAFALPAGEVGVALNAEYRKQSLVAISDAADPITGQPYALANCTGLRFCTPSTSTTEFRQASFSNSKGSLEVKEIGAEVLVPVLADTPFFKSLDLNGAVRYTDYSTSGGVTTWKAGIDWHLSDELSFRATRSRDIRAPTLTELFAPLNGVRTAYSDIQTNTSSTTTIFTGGNPTLKPEIANTFTVGGVYKPAWLPGFSIAVDFYDIKIKDAIYGLNGTSVAVQQQCINSGYTSSYCDLYVRPISKSSTTPGEAPIGNYPTAVFSRNVNAASEHAKGIDVDVIYNTGGFNFRVIGSYQPTRNVAVAINTRTLNDAGADGLPKYRLTGFIGYTTGAFSINTQTTWHSSTKHFNDPTIIYNFADSPARAFTDLNLSWDVPVSNGVKSQFFVNVSNVFNTSPGIFASPTIGVPGYGPISTNGDDPIGRSFTAGFRVKL